MVARTAGDTAGASVTMDTRLKWLAALAALGGTLILADRVFPGAGTIIAGAVLFWWLITSGGFTYIVEAINKLVKGIT